MRVYRTSVCIFNYTYVIVYVPEVYDHFVTCLSALRTLHHKTFIPLYFRHGKSWQTTTSPCLKNKTIEWILTWPNTLILGPGPRSRYRALDLRYWTITAFFTTHLHIFSMCYTDAYLLLLYTVL
jgi:hypothetical protein